MKAYDMMMYMLVFNLIIFMFATVGIFALGFTTITFVDTLAIGAVVGIITSISSAAVIGFFSRTEMSTTYWAIFTFSGVFWGTFTMSIKIFYSITSTLMSFGIGTFFMFAIYTSVVGYIFVFGIIQMIVGGAKSYK